MASSSPTGALGGEGCCEPQAVGEERKGRRMMGFERSRCNLGAVPEEEGKPSSEHISEVNSPCQVLGPGVSGLRAGA
jgi:hypothetical protein